MRNTRQILPVALAIAFGLLALIGLLFIPSLGNTLTSWASFLAAFALILGVLNLFSIHLRRLAKGNVYSGILIVSIFLVVVLAVTDYLDLSTQGVESAIRWLQVPLETSLVSLVGFFMLFAGARVLRRQPGKWSILFIVTVILFLMAGIALPSVVSDLLGRFRDLTEDLVVNAGMRGILIGVAIGTITVALRLLIGWERPYER